MPLDERSLFLHRRYEDAPRGFSEEFIRSELGGASTVAVLSRPLRVSRGEGWVICHSFGIEQINLNQLDVTVARWLAAAGFPCLRFHAPGYGDSRSRQVTFSSHLESAVDAVAMVNRHLHVEQVGVMGARFGSLVAAIAAERLGLSSMALWQPFVTGADFLRDYIQRESFAGLLDGEASGGRDRVDVRSDLASQGWCDLHGFQLSRETFEEISDVSLLDGLRRFGGTALLVGVSHTAAMPRAVGRLAAHLDALGATSRAVVVRGREGPMFGQHQFQKLPDGRGERDRFFRLHREIADVTVGWCAERTPSPREASG